MSRPDHRKLAGLKVLVTGSTGFKGSWLCVWLQQLGAKVSGFALPPEGEEPLFTRLGLDKSIDQHYGDIRDAALVQSVFDKTQPEVVIHLAAQALVRLSYQEPKATFDTNVGGGINLLEAVKNCPSLRALVFITSDKCYKNKEWTWGYRENDELGGNDPYSASKAAAELAFHSYWESYMKTRPNFGAASTRAGNVIGGGDMSRDRIVPDCIRALSAGKPIVLRNPNSTRPWQHVLEPLSGYLDVAVGLLEDPVAAEGPWNFGPDPENVRTVEELARKAASVWGSGEVRVEPELNAPHEAQLLMLSNDKAKTKLNWRARWDFETSVTKTTQWYKEVLGGADPVAVTLRQLEEYTEARK